MKMALGGTGWFIDFGRWLYGMGTGALSGGAGVLVLTPAIASIDPQHFNAFQPGPNTFKLMLYIFAYGAVKNALTYMATNKLPDLKDIRTTTLEPTRTGGVKLSQESYQETIPQKTDQGEKK